MIVKQEGLTYRGTKITVGDEPKLKRYLLNECAKELDKWGFQEISMPVIQYKDTFSSKVGEENRNMMLEVKDRSDRSLVLAPEYTAVIQKAARILYPNKQRGKLFYIAECFRGENVQYGRYRQFTQLGVEILNHPVDQASYLLTLARALIAHFYSPIDKTDFGQYLQPTFTVDTEAKRGLDYYLDPKTKLPGKGFEIHCDLLGTASQICGGGAYEGGQGFALGIDRLLLLKEKVDARSFVVG